MEALDYWRLCDTLSVIQAALLIVGEDPSSAQHYVEGWDPENRPAGYEAAKAALQNSILSEKLPANKSYEMAGYNQEPDPDWRRTTVRVIDLKIWLEDRGVTGGFFFPRGPSGPSYLDPNCATYAPKLAAAVRAWTEVSENADLQRGKSVKEALKIWLRQNANLFGLTKDDGNPNEQGIEDVAKVANWDITGGAPKTPG